MRSNCTDVTQICALKICAQICKEVCIKPRSNLRSTLRSNCANQDIGGINAVIVSKHRRHQRRNCVKTSESSTSKGASQCTNQISFHIPLKSSHSALKTVHRSKKIVSLCFVLYRSKIYIPNLSSHRVITKIVSSHLSRKLYPNLVTLLCKLTQNCTTLSKKLSESQDSYTQAPNQKRQNFQS